MSKPFHELRRQVFLTQPFFDAATNNLGEITQELIGYFNGPDGDLEDKRGWSFYISEDGYRLWSLRYTAGLPIEDLRQELTEVVEAYERYQKALAAYEGRPSISPLGLDQLGDYERAMQLIGLCYLLHRRDLLPRLADLIDPGYVGEDTLYEDLLAYALPGRVDLDEWYHDEPYTPLVHAMYEPDSAVASQKLDHYVNHWYKAFKYVPWHDGHLRINGKDGDYFGYWAFEAGAVALLFEIDDSKIEHMVYPKDLVAWARDNANRYPDGGLAAPVKSRHNVPGNAPCPKTGWWFTPAKAGSHRYFKQSEIMPSVGGDYGQTFWQWSPDQSAPKL